MIRSEPRSPSIAQVMVLSFCLSANMRTQLNTGLSTCREPLKSEVQLCARECYGDFGNQLRGHAAGQGRSKQASGEGPDPGCPEAVPFLRVEGLIVVAGAFYRSLDSTQLTVKAEEED